MRLKGRVAIVTGGARGLGKTYALRLAEEGAHVVIADILDGKGVEQAIVEKGGDALFLFTDVSNEESTEEMARKTAERFGKIDILVNNAAIFAGIETKPFFDISGDEWDAVMRVNLKGTFLCCKAVYPYMKKQHHGKIVNVSSGAFFKGLPYFIHYVTSKGGIVALTRALAKEVGDDGICVNAIAPGYTLSEAIREKTIHDEAFIKGVIGSRCFKRDALPEDITGWSISEMELRSIAERTWNLTRLFNVREGFSRKDDTLPERLFNEFSKNGPSKGQSVDREAFERMLDEYYHLVGWDQLSGIPTVEKLRELGIENLD